jgi:Tfp pilus assembly protein FimV
MFDSELASEQAFGTLGPMARTRVRRRRLVVTLAIAVLAASWSPALARAVAERAEPVSSRTYLVRPGDTLWAIAERVAPGEDPRPVVDAIADANGIDAGALVPGQRLVVPAD